MSTVRAKTVLLLLGGLLTLGLLALASATGSGPSEAQQGTMHNCPQPGRWAIAVWDGADGTDADQAFATCGTDAVAAAYSIDAQTQGWSRWLEGRPEMNTLSTLNNMQGVVALGGAGASAAASPAPSAQQDTMHNCPQPGRWAISVWSGDDGTDAGQALATCGEGAVNVAYYIEPDTQGWLRWFAGQPELGNLDTLNDMQGVIAHGAVGEAAVPFSLQLIPQSVKGETIAGQRCVFLIAVADEGEGGNEGEAVGISATAPGAEVTVVPNPINPGQVGEVTVIPDQASIGKTVTVTIQGERGGLNQAQTVTFDVVEGEDTLEAYATEVRDRFIPWLAINHPELEIRSDTQWTGTIVSPIWLVVSHYLFFSEEWEMHVSWHVMIAPHDWARIDLRHRFTEERPSHAFEISSLQAQERPHPVDPEESVWR